MSRKGCKDLKPRKKRTDGGGRLGKKNSVKHKAKQQDTRMRAGKRICSRCKEVFRKERGKRTICPRCRKHCKRCDVLLTVDNKYIPPKGKHVYMCKTCQTTAATQTARDSMLVRGYGITSPEYEAILEAQGGACYICRKIPKPGQNKLSVDHQHVKKDKKQNPRHTRKRVRGLLCWHCNAALGKFKDSIPLLEAAAAYLKELPAQQILNKEDTDE